MWRRLLQSARALWRKNKLEREMDQELRFHLEREIEENLRRGMSRDEARTAALRSFGGVERIKEECRDVNRLRWLETLWQDLRYGLRILRRNPGFTLLAVFTLALGIGANTAIFSVIYGVLLRPLPYQDGNQLVVIRQQAPLAGINNLNFSVKEITDYREQSQTLASMIEHHSMSFTLLGGAEPERIQTGVVSANFFEMMGVQPLLGRNFLPGDEAHGAEAVLMLSYPYWQRSHGGDPNIVGKVFAMNNRPHTVIGVLPPIPQYPNENDVYMPTSACPTRSSENFIANRNARMMSVFARLKPGVAVEQAQGDLGAIARRLQQAHPDAYPENRGYRATAASLHEELTRQARPTFLILLGTAGLVLLLACANVANLTLARLMRREREMAVRAALGARRGRLIRQLLTESTLLALVGGGLGILLASVTLDLLVSFAARFTPRAAEITMDGSVLIFTLLVSIITGLAFGLMPALSTKENLVTSLKEGAGQSTAGTARQRVRSLLVVAQVAVSFMLLIGAGLMVRSLLKLQQVHPGFDPEQVLVMRLSANWSKYNSAQQYREFYQRVLAKMTTQPGVTSAAMANTYPLNPLGIANGPFNGNFLIESRPLKEGELAPRADFRFASFDYFQTLRLPLIRGRTFTEQDHERAPAVAVINQALARQRWANEDPIGQRVSFNGGDSWATIVGIVGDTRQYGLDRESPGAIYSPIAQRGFANFLLVRAAEELRGLVRQVRRAVHEVDAETAIDHVHTLPEIRYEALASPRLTTILLTLFAALALVITAAGIVGVMALSVSQRTHELGIRLALGATQSSVLRMVVRQGMTLVVIGLALGTAGALVLTQLMSSLLFAIEPTDPLTFLAVSVVLAATAAIACFVPARRVTLIDPMLALRSE
jgi:putative ABC transport system permease protein